MLIRTQELRVRCSVCGRFSCFRYWPSRLAARFRSVSRGARSLTRHIRLHHCARGTCLEVEPSPCGWTEKQKPTAWDSLSEPIVGLCRLQALQLRSSLLTRCVRSESQAASDTTGAARYLVWPVPNVAVSARKSQDPEDPELRPS